MIIAVDFDGTCVTNEFPNIGKEIGATPVLRRLVAAGHKLILYTMRSDKKDVSTTDPTIKGVAGPFLTDAVAWFAERDIPLWGVNENPEQKNWTDSPKVYANYYIDDCAIGVPLKWLPGLKYQVVDWEMLELFLESRKVLPHTEGMPRFSSRYEKLVVMTTKPDDVTIRISKHG